MDREPEPPTIALNGRFSDLESIGSGAMARVYRATDSTTGETVAVKILRPEGTHASSRARFERELRIIREIVHPNVLTLIDAGTVESGELKDCLFFVMPLVRGETLRSKLDRERQLSVPEAIRIVSAVASGLAAAHERGVVHRDVKPENVLLEDDRVLVADFGIARLSDDRQGMTSSTGVVVGTPRYMSPEQVAGDKALDLRSEVLRSGLGDSIGHGDVRVRTSRHRGLLAAWSSCQVESLTPRRCLDVSWRL